MKGLDLADVVALAAEASDVEAAKLLELLDSPEVAALLPRAQPPVPPHEAAGTLLVGLVTIAPLPTGNRRLAVLTALQLLAGYGLDADLDPHATNALLASVQAGGHDARSVSSWLDAQVTARDPLEGALRALLAPDALRAIGLAVAHAHRNGRLMAAPADVLAGLYQEGTGPAAVALGADGPAPGHLPVHPAVGPYLEPAARKVMELALRAAITCGHREVNGGHLVLGLLEQGDEDGRPEGLDAGDVRRRVLDLLGSGESPEGADLEARLARLMHRLSATDPPAVGQLAELVDVLRDGLDCLVAKVLAWRGAIFLEALRQDEAVHSLLALQRPGPEAADVALLAGYVADVNQYPCLSPPEEAEHFRAIRTGLEPEAALSRRRLIQSNLRLVVSIARVHEATGVPLLDLIQEGNLGLMQAVERYDVTKGYPFTTFATWWIRNYVQRAAGRPRA